MADSFKVLLEFIGKDSASGAVGKIGKSLDGLGSRMKAAAAAANQASKQINGSLKGIGSTNAGSAFTKLTSAAQKAGMTVRQMLTGKIDTTALDRYQKSLVLTERKVAMLKDELAKLQSQKADPQVARDLAQRLTLAREKAELLRAALERAMAGNAPNANRINTLRTQLTTAEQNARKLAQALDQAGREPDNAQKILALQTQIQAATTKADLLRQKMSKVMSTPLSGGLMGGFAKMFGDKGYLVGFSRGLEGLRKQLMNVNDYFRFMGQGMATVGRSMMFFISLPIAAFTGSLVSQAISFEDAMVRVQKTTGLEGEQVQQLSGYIRELAKNTATSHTDLAGIAEVIGQLGVQSVGAIANLTQTFDMFSIATGIAGQEVATNLGQISAAFGWDLNNSTDNVERLANTINELENTTAATAGQIMASMAEFAPFAKMLDISADKAAALSATLVSLGLSANEAGTSLKNMSINLPRHAADLSKLLGGVVDGFGSKEEILKRMNEDIVGVFKDLVMSAAAGNDEVATLLGLMEVADIRGGRGLAAMAGNTKLLKDNLENAKNAWRDNTSLIKEYDRAMQSTKSQIAMLKNNINDAGIVIGDALLPAIQRMVQIAVPAIQMLAEAFKNLKPSQQMAIIGAVGLVVVLGPLLAMLGQIVTGMTMGILAFGQLSRVMIAMIAVVGRLGSILPLLGKAFMGWPGIAIAAVSGLLLVLQNLGVDIGGIFKRIADAALSWGENLASNLADGLLAGAVRYIAQAINYVASLIASFFESHSPPKEGPLSTIDQWGRKIMETYINGFKSADFSILEDVASTIEHMLTAGLDDEALVGGLRQLAKSRVMLAKLIEEFNNSGVINENMLDEATEGLGDMAGKVKELIRLNLRYKDLQQRLAEIESRREEIKQSYDDEIASIGMSNMSIVEKIDAIRKLRRTRDAGLDGLDEEEERLKAQAELVKEQLDTQKAMIDTLNKQEDIFRRIAELLEKIDEERKNKEKGKGKEKGGGLEELAGGFGPITEFAEKTKDDLLGIGEQWKGVVDRFSEGRKMLEGFFDALNGKDAQTNLGEKIQPGYDAMYKLGDAIANVRDKATEMWDTLSTGWERIKETFSGGSEGGLFAGILGNQDVITVLVRIGDVAATVWWGLQQFGAWLSSVFGPTFKSIGDQISTLGPVWEQLKQSFSNLWTALQPLLPVLGQLAVAIGVTLAYALGFVVAQVAGAIAGIAQFVTGLLNGLAQVVTGVSNWVSGILTYFQGFWQVVKGLFTNNSQLIQEGFQKMADGTTRIWQGLAQIIQGIVNFLLTGVLGGLLTFIRSTLATMTALFGDMNGNATRLLNEFTALVDTFLSNASELMNQKVTEWIQAGVNLVQGLLDGAAKTWTGLVQKVAGWLDEFIGLFYTKLEMSSPSRLFMDIGVNLIQGLINGISSMLGPLTEIFNTIVNTVTNAIKGLFGGGDQQQSGGGFDINSLLPNPQDILARTAEVQNTIDRFTDKLGKSVEHFGKSLTKMWDGMWGDVEKSTPDGDKIVETFSKGARGNMERTSGDIRKQWADALKGVEDTTSKAASSASSSMDKMGKAAKDNLGRASTVTKELDREFNRLKGTMGGTDKTMASFKSSVNGINTTKVSTMATSWGNVAKNLNTATSRLSEFIKNLDGLRNTTITATVTAKTSGASINLSRLSGTQDTTTWTGTGYGTIGGGSSGDNGSFGPPTGGPRASGGHVVPGHAYTVGELGEEVYVPNRPGTIVPSGLFQRLVHGLESNAGGGSPIYVTINNPVVRDGADIRSLADQVARELAKRTNGRMNFGGNLSM